jgi:hypothetical protein
MKRAVILSLILIFSMTGCNLTGQQNAQKVITLEEAKVKAVDFINNNLMQAGSQVSVKEAIEENGLYKIVVNMANGQEVDTYLSKDGEKFFPQVMEIEEIEKQNEQSKAQQEATQAQTAADISKSDKPKVDLFIMSHCPFGTQIEKGILPVLDILGSKIDFELKFCDYAMHDKKELDEQLNQYCIQKNEPDKLISYLYCFLQEGKTEECLIEIGINKTKLNSCISETDKNYKVTEQYNDKSTWRSGRYPVFNVYQTDNTKYGITGSPALVVNEKKISSNRDSASLLKTICAGFNDQPEECQEELSSTTPSSGFGFSTSGSNASGGCSD